MGMKSILEKLCFVFTVVVLAGVAPNYFLLWALWRIVSSFMSQSTYQDGDDFLYSMYQRMVLFLKNDQMKHVSSQRHEISRFFSAEKKRLLLDDSDAHVANIL